MKGFKVQLVSSAKVAWAGTGIVVAEPAHFLKDIGGDRLSFWYVPVMDDEGIIYSVELEDLRVLIPQSIQYL